MLDLRHWCWLGLYPGVSNVTELTVGDVTQWMNAQVPECFADEWDNVGLQVGSKRNPLRGIAVALEASAAVLDRLPASVNLLITHHPLIFEPLRRLGDHPVETRVRHLIREEISLYCAHTNLDRMDWGPSGQWAKHLALQGIRPLEAWSDLAKVVVFVPRTHVHSVRQAMGDAGAGELGEYSHCAFFLEGTGSFLPGANANPFIGTPGRVEEVAEARLESVVPRSLLSTVLNAIQQAHPYEEVAYDVYPLDNSRNDVGMGRIGDLPESVSVHDLLGVLKQRVPSVQPIRHTGDGKGRVQRVAVCGGRGEKLGSVALAMGADVLITGDVTYHVAQDLADRGLAVVDLGHVQSERLIVRPLAAQLDHAFGGYVPVSSLDQCKDPWGYCGLPE